MTDAIDTATKRFQCRHIHADGRRCGSASLRGEEFCYFHHTSRKPVGNPRARRSRAASFDLPLPEDRAAIQLSIGEVLRRIASNQIDPRRAGLLLYGLQIASINLPHRRFGAQSQPAAEAVVEEIVTHPTHGSLAPSAELPHPDAPHRNSLTAQLLQALQQGRQEIERECEGRLRAEQQIHPEPQPQSQPQAEFETQPQAESESEPLPQPQPESESQPEPATLPTLNAAALTSHTTPTQCTRRPGPSPVRQLPRPHRGPLHRLDQGHAQPTLLQLQDPVHRAPRRRRYLVFQQRRMRTRLEHHLR